MSIGAIQGVTTQLAGSLGLDPAELTNPVIGQNLPGVASAGQLAPAQAGQSCDGVQPASFSNILEGAVREVDGKMKAAEVEQNKLLTGETSNLHQSMIAMQEANVSFSLMVEVRNKLVDSYQELMRMQI